MTGREFWDLFGRHFTHFPEWESLSVRGQLAAEDAARDVAELQHLAHEDGYAKGFSAGRFDAEEERGPECALRWLFK